jgi:hypothetical protein
MQNTTSYNKPQDAMTPAVQAESPVMGGECTAGKGGVFENGGASNQAGSGFTAGLGEHIGTAGKCDSGMMGGVAGGMGGKADNCAGMGDKKTPGPEVAQGGPLQTYSGDAGWKS